MRAFLVTVVVVAVSPSVAATAIMVARTASAIYIGADSRRTVIDERGAISACKIVRHHDVYVVAAGPVGFRGGFDLHGLLRTAVPRAGTMRERIAAIDAVLRPVVAKLAADIRRLLPVRFRTRYQGRYFLQTVFATLENGRPTTGSLLYRPIVSAGGTVTLDARLCPPQCTEDENVFLLGQTGEMRQMVPYHLSLGATDAEFRSSIHLMIAGEIRKTPSEVGFPVNILKIDEAGAHWLERASNSPCAVVL
jgi:hypothetical protein